MASFVNIIYDSNSVIKCIIVEGHAGIKKSGEGYEVCIALSTLTQAMYRALNTVIGRRFLRYRVSGGSLSLEIINFDKLDINKKNELKSVSNGYLIGIKSLIKEYPDYIKYKEEYKNGT
ncbi:ribosomal-processing cysteine protease Prp [uncultured Brachyspira sp.]|uniref:ribosomal-processing cysteine protease Prp n=1 Tax=uncultured Brachyspira sp. TaxID=221953 RepID=UPI0025FDD545|nr:ribosomal-processing cysteine protease Prp [uncultured Brachyspira sp.]